MSGKAAYTLFLSFMALFAALAAQGKELASAERAAVMATIGQPAAHAKALAAYDKALTRTLTRLYGVKKAPQKKVILAKKISKAPPEEAVEEENAPVSEVKTVVVASATPVEEKVSQPEPVPLSDDLAKIYAQCMQNRPKECCTPMVDHRAAMPASCASRSIASESAVGGAENTAAAPVNPAAGTGTAAGDGAPNSASNGTPSAM